MWSQEVRSWNVSRNLLSGVPRARNFWLLPNFLVHSMDWYSECSKSAMLLGLSFSFMSTKIKLYNSFYNNQNGNSFQWFQIVQQLIHFTPHSSAPMHSENKLQGPSRNIARLNWVYVKSWRWQRLRVDNTPSMNRLAVGLSAKAQQTHKVISRTTQLIPVGTGLRWKSDQ